LAVDGWAVTFVTLYSELGPGRGLSPPRTLLVVPNVDLWQPTRQRPVYQSPYCCNVVRCSAVLMCLK